MQELTKEYFENMSRVVQVAQEVLKKCNGKSCEEAMRMVGRSDKLTGEEKAIAGGYIATEMLKYREPFVGPEGVGEIMIRTVGAGVSAKDALATVSLALYELLSCLDEDTKKKMAMRTSDIFAHVAQTGKLPEP